MKIYAIRDRLIDHWGQPFAGPDHGSVKQALARTVNTGDATSDIAQAPHQFEIHQLGYVTEDGHLVPERVYICDCSSLIRRSVRPHENHDRAGPEARTATGTSLDGAGGRRAGTDADPRPVPNAPQGASDAAEEVRRGPTGGYPPRGE